MRLPGPTNRTVILGQNGSGKSTFGTWLLSQMNWHQQPWIIVDYKYDELLSQLPTQELLVTDRLPKHPGLYVVHPYGTRVDQQRMVRAGTLNEEAIAVAVENMLLRIWARERIGLYLDEGYLVPDRSALKTLLVTGRSKHIPMIINSQRPVMVPRHVFSESNFFVVFRLNDSRDIKIVRYFAPIDMENSLPEFHSYYYDAAHNEMAILSPVPDADTILSIYDDRMRTHRGMSWR